MRKESKTIVLEELERVNTDKKLFKTIFQMDDEIVTGLEFDLPLGGGIVVTKSSKEKSELKAYVISRCTLHQFYCEKVHFKQFSQGYQFVKGVDTEVRNDCIIYETMPINLEQVQQILLLKGGVKRSLSDWFDLFDRMIQYIKIGPKSIEGKPIKEQANLFKTL